MLENIVYEGHVIMPVKESLGMLGILLHQIMVTVHQITGGYPCPKLLYLVISTTMYISQVLALIKRLAFNGNGNNFMMAAYEQYT